MNLKGKHFLKLLDFTPEEIMGLINLAEDLKKKKKAGIPHRLCEGKSIALIFEKNSTRTRCAFEVAAADLGMHPVYLDPSGSQIGKKESIADTARVLGRIFDGIVQEVDIPTGRVLFEWHSYPEVGLKESYAPPPKKSAGKKAPPWDYFHINSIDEEPNGNLLVSGEKQMGINQGTEFIRFSGVVNPRTVSGSNTVPSTLVADARIEYTAKGYIDEAQHMGWMQRFFLNVMPF
jgi:hypothetical protein